MPNLNEDAFSRLLGATFKVALQRPGTNVEGDVQVECRALPFGTLSYVLGIVMQSTRDEIVKARRQVIDDMIAAGFRDIDTDKLKDILIPVFAGMVTEIPHLADRFLMDVVLGCTEERVKVFTLDDVIVIMEACIARLNTERVAEKMYEVFTRAMEMMAKAMKIEEAIPLQPSISPSPNPSPESLEPSPT